MSMNALLDVAEFYPGAHPSAAIYSVSIIPAAQTVIHTNFNVCPVSGDHLQNLIDSHVPRFAAFKKFMIILPQFPTIRYNVEFIKL